MDITLDRQYLDGYIEEKEYTQLLPEIQKAHEDLENKTGKGSDFTGWLDLPQRIEDSFLDELVELGKEIQEKIKEEEKKAEEEGKIKFDNL